MKKNGFIATSLIYTFFLMFVTLFLSIIADYLQNKVLLETTEKSIKDNLNSIIGIRDLEVGNVIAFTDNCDLEVYDIYIIANINVIENSFVAYSYNLYDSEPQVSNLTYDHLINDFSLYGGYYNESYFEKIIYTFDASTGKEYNLGNEYYVTYISSDINTTITCESEYQTDDWCIKKTTPSNNKYRKRYYKKMTANLNKCPIESNDGTIYISVPISDV